MNEGVEHISTSNEVRPVLMSKYKNPEMRSLGHDLQVASRLTAAKSFQHWFCRAFLLSNSIFYSMSLNHTVCENIHCVFELIVHRRRTYLIAKQWPKTQSIHQNTSESSSSTGLSWRIISNVSNSRKSIDIFYNLDSPNFLALRQFSKKIALNSTGVERMRGFDTYPSPE